MNWIELMRRHPALGSFRQNSRKSIEARLTTYQTETRRREKLIVDMNIIRARIYYLYHGEDHRFCLVLDQRTHMNHKVATLTKAWQLRKRTHALLESICFSCSSCNVVRCRYVTCKR